MDGRDKPDHDEEASRPRTELLRLPRELRRTLYSGRSPETILGFLRGAMARRLRQA
ncbi:hypothetical protein BOSE62_40611 [Bosea sp. 62]|nr:hypothetical protein BOSE46_120171 [Bosea sp. 46]CAD5259938.1 hypothetical protein BOSE21B_110387 [Bosea sp. 21B]CAD5280742.1 hypothetical protein BOSE7B_40828 [Bosea sp. 7B]VVT58149.1 hypothetical protein BOS5A_200441 [Bosea sp. EC-HK365B]VXB47511.1 hypothetical protein BOSE29B_110336 [Bosea sp. 29B]VXB90720.1 hypothetical protein BOSE125_160127 [Bosea sp. 125]VXC50165.1 hypothetical protein BOSE62_40611 [Bosea sp. 62]VXC85178.1 hypothetical protein BOSE127_60226 [Bosea sp. 127]